MATAAQITACKAYMRVDGDGEDALIGGLCDAAAGYLRSAGCVRSDSDEAQAAQYDLALWSLTLHYYDHRDAVGAEAPLPLGLGPVLVQLKVGSQSV